METDLMITETEDLILEVKMLRREVVELRTQLDATFDAFTWLLGAIKTEMFETDLFKTVHSELNGQEMLSRTGGRPARAVFLEQLLDAMSQRG